MIRQTKRPSIAQCNLLIFMGFQMAESHSVTCTQLADTYQISHDSVNRFLERERFTPHDLFTEAFTYMPSDGLTVSVDDTVLDKPYSQHMDDLGFFWSGKHHRSVKGINLITLYATSPCGKSAPINFRVYKKIKNKTKNDYFKDMLDEILQWKAKVQWVTGDCWYASTSNLKTIKKHGIGFMFGISSNRKVSLKKEEWHQLQDLPKFENGQKVWLKDFGFVQLFETRQKNQRRFYIVYHPKYDLEASEVTYEAFKSLHDTHWKIEQYHRVIKQICHIEKFQVRRRELIANYLFSALMAYIQIQKMQIDQIITNIYQWQKELFRPIIQVFIQEFSVGKEHLLPQQQSSW